MVLLQKLSYFVETIAAGILKGVCPLLLMDDQARIELLPNYYLCCRQCGTSTIIYVVNIKTGVGKMMHRMKKWSSPTCPRCDKAEDTEHVDLPAPRSTTNVGIGNAGHCGMVKNSRNTNRNYNGNY
jgi:hypothetical protein